MFILFLKIIDYLKFKTNKKNLIKKKLRCGVHTLPKKQL